MPPTADLAALPRPSQTISLAGLGNALHGGIVMRSSLGAFVAILATVCSVTRADELGKPIDLSGLSEINSAWDEPIDDEGSKPAPAALDPNAGHHRFYVTGIVGASFATLSPNSNPFGFTNTPAISNYFDNGANGTLFNGGGAVGVAFARSSGQLRVEFEQRLRGPLNDRYLDTTGFVEPVPFFVKVDNAWSSMANVWRDLFVTDRLGFYGGAGIGLGGYRATAGISAGGGDVTGYPPATVSTWAWQAGTGVVYQISNRITVDTGYRFFSTAPAGCLIGGSGVDTVTFSASELLLSVRIYEPFRNWR